MPHGTQPRTGIRRRQAIAYLVASRAVARISAAEEPPIRLGISETLLTGVNVNDARAAMVVWVNRIGPQYGMRVEMDPRIYFESQDLQDRVRRGSLDGVAINAIEYRLLSSSLDRTVIIGDPAGGQYENVLLVNRASGLRRLADLRGRHLLTSEVHSCMAPAWLATLVSAEGGRTPLDFFGSISRRAKSSHVILPVFFGQADACLTTRREFRIICELNPQVAEKLEALVTSPVLVSTCYAFRRGYSGVNRDRMIAAITGLKAHPAWQQVRTLFQYSGLIARDASCMERSVALLDEADRLSPGRRTTP